MQILFRDGGRGCEWIALLVYKQMAHHMDPDNEKAEHLKGNPSGCKTVFSLNSSEDMDMNYKP